jgi:hypothetical protein
MGLPSIGPIEVVITMLNFLIVLGIPVAIIYLLVRVLRAQRDKRRICPACGTPAGEGVTACQRCGFDYRAAAGMPPSVQPMADPDRPPGSGPADGSADPPVTWSQELPAQSLDPVPPPQTTAVPTPGYIPGQGRVR